MTVASNHSRIDYTGNGSTAAFAYDFRILDETDLQVYLDGVLQALTEDYTVTGVDAANGGTVTFVSAPPAFSRIALIRQVAIEQNVSYPAAGAFPAEAHEAALDRLTMIAQQLVEKAGRSLAFAETSTKKDVTLPEPLANALMRWKTDLSGLENVSSSNPFGGDVTVLTSKGDLIQGGESGIPENLPVGGTGSLLTVALGKAAWTTLTAWLASVGALSTKGGLISSTGAVVQQLPAGLDGTVLQADSASPLGLRWVATNAVIPTGVGADYWGATAPAGWVLLAGKSIGDGSSNATERANADTADLFTLVWNSLANTEAPVQDSTGAAVSRGADAATDFAAHRRIVLPDLRGRVTAGKDNMGGTAANRLTVFGATALGVAGGAQQVTLTTGQIPAHTHGVSDPSHAHSVSDPQHAHSMADPGTQGVLTPGSGTSLYAASGPVAGMITNAASTGVAVVAAVTGISIQSAGSGQAHDNVQPTVVVNKIIKL